MIDIPPHIRNLKAYAPGKPISELKREKGLKRIVKLASNENPMGPSPKALAAITEHLHSLHMYPDPQAYDLREALAKHYGRDAREIICGSGVDSILAYMINAFTNTGDEVLTFEGTFIGTYVNTKKFSRALVCTPLKNYQYDIHALLSKVTERTRMIYIANPNNPTGAMIAHQELKNFMSIVPPHTLVILDEAYHSFASHYANCPNGMDTIYDNLIVTRTFSKDYGLAGLRVGCAVGPKRLISELYKVKLPFEPNTLAQYAVIAALEDTDYLKQSIVMTEQSLQRMVTQFRKLGISFVKPTTNFIMLTFASESYAMIFHDECLNQGLILRHLAPFGIPEGVRINAGTPDETTFALDIIQKIYKKIV